MNSIEVPYPPTRPGRAGPMGAALRFQGDVTPVGERRDHEAAHVPGALVQVDVDPVADPDGAGPLFTRREGHEAEVLRTRRPVEAPLRGKGHEEHGGPQGSA